MPTITRHPVGSPCWVDLATPDAAAARRFYTELFGWTYDIGGPEMGFYAMIRRGEDFVGGIGQPPPEMAMPAAWTVYLSTDDAAATLAAVQAKGGKLLFGPMEIPGTGVQVVAVDPTGAVFGFWQAKPFIGATVQGEVGSLAWCEVNTRRGDEARDFYAGIFGFTSTAMEGGIVYHTLHLDGVPRCGVLQMNERWPETIPPHWMVYFAVANADAAVARLRELGGSVHMPPFDTPFGRIAVVADPAGATFSLLQPPARG